MKNKRTRQMSDKIRVKICGLCHESDLAAAVEAGAAYVGFVFYSASPRSISLQRAWELAAGAKGAVKVALTVDETDGRLEQIVDAVDPGLLQLHGAESPQRAAEVRRRFGRPVMKAVGIRDAADLAVAESYDGAADQLLIDAKPVASGSLPGGNGIAFDWRLLAGWTSPLPWMLAGGLNSGNVGNALALTGAEQVDVSTGVESSPGKKSAEQIAAFVRAAQGRCHAD